MSNRKIDEFFQRKPVNREKPPEPEGNIVYDLENMQKDREDLMDVVEPEKSHQVNKANNTQPGQQSYLRFPHHTKALWASRKPHLYAIATKQNCSVEFIMQTIFQNIVECRIMNPQHLNINVINQFLNEFDSPQVLEIFALIAAYALEAELLFTHVRII